MVQRLSGVIDTSARRDCHRDRTRCSRMLERTRQCERSGERAGQRAAACAAASPPCRHPRIRRRRSTAGSAADPPPPDRSVIELAMAGYWKGTATRRGLESHVRHGRAHRRAGNAQWLLLRAGLLEDDGFVVFANVCCESQFEDDVIGKDSGRNRPRDASIEAEVDGGVLSGELQFRDDDYRFTLNASSDYDRSVSLATLAVCTRAARDDIRRTSHADGHDRVERPA